MNQLVQSEPSTARPPSRPPFRPPTPVWQIVVLAGLCLWLYWSTLGRLIGQWWHDPNFSHGFFVPLFSGFVLWQERDRLARLPIRPSWSGLPLLILAVLFLVIGQLGAELFLARSSFILLLAGLTVLFLGWSVFRATLFPWAFLFLMIPIPTILFNQITFPLQLLTSQVAAAILPLLGVPILREGNVIYLPAMALEVAEACSGIRSLMSLLTLAIIYGYLTEHRLWVRWLLAIASVPIAVAANAVRIIGTGLLVQYWDADKAEGYFHASWGWVIFVISLLMLYGVHALIRWIWPDQEEKGREEEKPGGKTPERKRMSGLAARFVFAALLIASAAIFLQARARNEIFPPRLPLQQFPHQLGAWTGTDFPLDSDVLEKLGPGDFMVRIYQNQQEPQPYVDLYIAYFPSQRAGDTIHSPKNCLPGAGWTPVESSRIQLDLPGHAPFPANRYVIQKGDAKQVVLYWYWAHDRGVASEYWAKFYLVADSIRMNRTDGALVRITTPMQRGESVEAAERRMLPFANEMQPLLDSYIPR